MGWRGINIPSILVILSLIVVLFGSKRLKHIGGDLAKAIKDFRSGLQTNSDDHHA